MTTRRKVIDPPLPPRLLTVAQACDILAVGKTTIYALMADGSLPYTTIRSHRRIRVRDLEKLIERNSQ